MTSINVEVIGLTRPGFKAIGSRLEPPIFRFPDLPEQEAGALLIQPPGLVYYILLIKNTAYIYVFLTHAWMVEIWSQAKELNQVIYALSFCTKQFNL